jgi:FixJ family two-component response regulator
VYVAGAFGVLLIDLHMPLMGGMEVRVVAGFRECVPQGLGLP